MFAAHDARRVAAAERARVEREAQAAADRRERDEAARRRRGDFQIADGILVRPDGFQMGRHGPFVFLPLSFQLRFFVSQPEQCPSNVFDRICQFPGNCGYA